MFQQLNSNDVRQVLLLELISEGKFNSNFEHATKKIMN